MCRHPAGTAELEHLEYVRLLTGDGLDHDMCCTACDEAMRQGSSPDLGVRVFDVTIGAEVHAFPGPRGALFAVGQRLYAAAPDGLEIWDPSTGHRTGRVAGFLPTHHHPTTGQLAAVQGSELLRWRGCLPG